MTNRRKVNVATSSTVPSTIILELFVKPFRFFFRLSVHDCDLLGVLRVPVLSFSTVPIRYSTSNNRRKRNRAWKHAVCHDLFDLHFIPLITSMRRLIHSEKITKNSLELINAEILIECVRPQAAGVTHSLTHTELKSRG